VREARRRWGGARRRAAAAAARWRRSKNPGGMGWGGRGGYGEAHCGLDLTEGGRRTEIDERAALRRRNTGGFSGASSDSARVGLGRVRGGAEDLKREEEEGAARRGGGRRGGAAGRGGAAAGRLQGAGREVRPRRLCRRRGRAAAVQAGGAAAGRAGGAATGERHKKIWQPDGVPLARSENVSKSRRGGYLYRTICWGGRGATRPYKSISRGGWPAPKNCFPFMAENCNSTNKIVK